VSVQPKIDSIYDFTDKGLVELKAWLEPWFLDLIGSSRTASHTPFFTVITELASLHDLRGYWRLGDGSSPFADTSGHAAGPAPAVKDATGTAMDEDTPGALPIADDDGAVQFTSATGGAADFLAVDESGTGGFRFDLTSGDVECSIVAWVEPHSSASAFDGSVIQNISEPVPFGPCGWRLYIDWPTRVIKWHRREEGFTPTDVTVSGPSLPTTAWSFVVATYDSTNGMQLYVDGSLYAADPTLFGALMPGSSSPDIGYLFYGGIDEVSVWGDALTAAEILSLYNAGVGS
jgi:hypothetical protein